MLQFIYYEIKDRYYKYDYTSQNMKEISPDQKEWELVDASDRRCQQIRITDGPIKHFDITIVPKETASESKEKTEANIKQSNRKDYKK